MLKINTYAIVLSMSRLAKPCILRSQPFRHQSFLSLRAIYLHGGKSFRYYRRSSIFRGLTFDLRFSSSMTFRWIRIWHPLLLHLQPLLQQFFDLHSFLESMISLKYFLVSLQLGSLLISHTFDMQSLFYS